MCRLAMFNKKGLEIIDRDCGLKDYLDYLEKSQGGDGNGVALIRDGKCTLLKKGLKLSNATIDKIIRTNEFDWVIYHTRIASIGSKNTMNCHPFKFNEDVLAMNGTEVDFEFLADIQGITDTEAILNFAEKENQDLIDVTSQLNSVFLGLYKGEVFATAGNGANFKFSVVQEDDGIIFASEFPEGFNVKKPKDFPFVWLEGDKLYLREETENERLFPMRGYGVWNKYNDEEEDYRRYGYDRYFTARDLELMRENENNI